LLGARRAARALGVVACGLALLWAVRARALPEDLKREIEAKQAAISDFERLDPHHYVTDEITLLRTWLDEAWGQYAKEEYDRVREILERAGAQAELIRQKTTAANLMAQSQEREAQLKAMRDKLEHTKQALQQALIKKKALEMNVK
jgi:hypothetical protein